MVPLSSILHLALFVEIDGCDDTYVSDPIQHEKLAMKLEALNNQRLVVLPLPPHPQYPLHIDVLQSSPLGLSK